MVTREDNVTRIGAISRTDFPSEGFRAGLLHYVADVFRKANVHYIVWTSIVDGVYVKTKTRKLERLAKLLEKEKKALLGDSGQAAVIAEANKFATRLLKMTADVPEAAKLAAAVKQIKAAIKDLKVGVGKDAAGTLEAIAAIDERLARYHSYREELQPDKMAEQLNRLIPVFKDAAGETIKIYVVTSPRLDGEIGEVVVDKLSELRKSGPDDIRIYKSGSDQLVAKQAGKTVQILVPVRSKMPGKYYSTGVEGAIEDFRRQTSRSLPDMFIVGGYGSYISKPRGESCRPFVSVPTLRRLQTQDLRPYENQTGAVVIELVRDLTNPIVHSFPLRDMVGHEEQFIKVPGKLEPKRAAIIEALKDYGQAMPIGMLVDNTGLARKTVEAEVEALINKNGKRPETWCGLRRYRSARKVGFDTYWLRENLRYIGPTEDLKTDTIEFIGCLHAGSKRTHYRFVQEQTIHSMIANEVDFLALPGDLVEGIKYGKDEHFGSLEGDLNVTDQEHIAGQILANINTEVFRFRFERALKPLHGTPSPEDLEAIVDKSLPGILMIPGNHDMWATGGGHTPLDVLKHHYVERIYEGVAGILAGHGLCLMCLNRSRISKSKVPEPIKLLRFSVPTKLGGKKCLELEMGVFDLPSGLRTTLLHPFMGRTKTTSIRLQEMLDFAADSHLVIGANFHVSEYLEIWEGELGQRGCVEIGTAKVGSGFEDHKLKRVDQGTGLLKSISACGSRGERRIIQSACVFYTAGKSRDFDAENARFFAELLSQARQSD